MRLFWFRSIILGIDKVIRVRVITKAGKNSVERFDGGLKVRLTVPPIGGKANKALIEILAESLNLKKSQLRIVSGKRSKDKLIKLEK